MHECDENAECGAFTYYSDTNECLLEAKAEADYNPTARIVKIAFWLQYSK